MPSRNAARYCTRAPRPLRRRLRARYSLSHSADGGGSERGANFDVKLHHNNGSQHVVRGGGGGSRAITEHGLSGGAEQSPCLYVTQFNSSSFAPLSLLARCPLSLMPLPGMQVN